MARFAGRCFRGQAKINSGQGFIPPQPQYFPPTRLAAIDGLNPCNANFDMVSTGELQ